jgi:predicted nucleic acid-binding protein
MPEIKEIVINTGPLLALISALGDLSFLKSLYNRVLVPFEVCQEIECGGASDFGVVEFKKAKFIQKRLHSIIIAPFLHNALDLGEAAVIQLALDEKIDTVCIDEAIGRRIARLNGLNLTGSIGILIRAKKNGLDFSMRSAIDQMQSRGIYLSKTVINFAISQVSAENPKH